MSVVHRRRLWAEGVSVGLVVLLASLPGVIAGATPSFGAEPRPTSLAAPSVAALVYHANLSFTVSVPAVVLPMGVEFGSTYEVVVPTFPSSSQPEYVLVPGALLRFPTSVGYSQLNLPAVNVTIRDNGTVTVPIGPLIREAAGRTIPINQTATLSTQGVAVSATWPAGKYPTDVRWQWLEVNPNGGRTNGSWSAWQEVDPAQVVSVLGTVPKIISVGNTYPICLEGPIAGRSFAVHLSVGLNGTQIKLGVAEVPLLSPSPFCFNNTLSVPVSPQAAYLHVWEDGSTPYLHFVFKVQVENPGGETPSGPSRDLPAFFGVPSAYLIVAGVLLIVALAMVLWVRRRPPTRVAPVAIGALPPAPPPPLGDSYTGIR